MIFSLFKKKQQSDEEQGDSDAAGLGAAASGDGRGAGAGGNEQRGGAGGGSDQDERDALTDQYADQYEGAVLSPSERSTKKTKVDKRNTALTQKTKKTRSNRTVHTRRSFHRGDQKKFSGGVNIYDVIEQPVVTEKSANMSERGVYVFMVRDDSNKHTVADAVEELYGVRPRTVRIAKRAPKKKRLRITGKEQEYGMTNRRKKAYVFLREGDTIKLS